MITVLVLGLGCSVGCGGSNGPYPSGTLEATEINLSMTIGGRALEVRPRLGDHVTPGDTLVVLDTELIGLQRAQAEANRASIVAQRKVAGETIRQAERGLNLAETTLARARSLLAQGSASQQQVDDLMTKRDVAKSQLAAARYQLEFLAAEEAKITAALNVFDRQTAEGVLICPANGTVLVRALEPGETAIPGSTVLRIADLSRLELRVFLEAEDLDRVRIGQKLPILIDALEGKEREGTVTWISSEAEFTPKNVQTKNARAQLVYAVKLRVDNPDGQLHIGMPAEIRL